jgi:hypothetical protein
VRSGSPTELEWGDPIPADDGKAIRLVASLLRATKDGSVVWDPLAVQYQHYSGHDAEMPPGVLGFRTRYIRNLVANRQNSRDSGCHIQVRIYEWSPMLEVIIERHGGGGGGEVVSCQAPKDHPAVRCLMNTLVGTHCPVVNDDLLDFARECVDGSVAKSSVAVPEAVQAEWIGIDDDDDYTP